MTPQKAIEKIKWIMQNKSHNKEFCYICIEALEKQVAKKPIANPSRVFNSQSFHCPTCTNKIVSKFDDEWIAGKPQSYCEECGQALDWSDTE